MPLPAILRFRPNIAAVAASILSVLAVVTSGWAAYESRQARLDVGRSELRSEIENVIDDFRRVSLIMRCYVQTANLNAPNMQASINDVEGAIGRLAAKVEQLPSFGEDELNVERNKLSSGKSKINAALRVTMMEIRQLSHPP